MRNEEGESGEGRPTEGALFISAQLSAWATESDSQIREVLVWFSHEYRVGWLTGWLAGS